MDATTTTPTTHKQATKDATLVVALELIEKNGSTSTKEVKDHMRSQDFWADQKDISNWMKEIERENKVESTYANGHRTYTVPPVVSVADPAIADHVDSPTDSTIATTATDTETAIKDTLFNLFHIYRGVVKPTSRLKEDLGLANADINKLCNKLNITDDGTSYENGTVSDLIKAIDKK